MTPQPTYPVVILAGGLARRMGSLTQSQPKALIELNGEPFIFHQLRLLQQRGIREVVLCIGHYGEQIEEAIRTGFPTSMNVRFEFDGPKLLGTAGAIKRILPSLAPNFFVLYGDSYLPCDYRAVQRAFDPARHEALMTVFRNEGRFDRSNVEFAEGTILVYDKLQQTERMHHIDYGLGIFGHSAFDAVPEATAWDLAQVFQSVLARGKLAAFEVAERFYEIGSFAGLEETRQYLAHHPTIPGIRP